MMRSPVKNSVASSQIAIHQPHGYVTAANVTTFQETLTQLVTARENSIFLIDMQKVEFLDSAGLMALVAAFRLAQSLGKHFSLCSLAPSVRIIFELTQLDRVLEIFEDRGAFELSLNATVAA